MSDKKQKQSSRIESVKEPMLATMVVTAYNHEKYIREAIEGAFSQTYSPLEIILSDDCSSDSSYEIMSSMARDYRGPHTVHLNRNKTNLGVAEHVNLSARMMNGEIRIGAAGDDISLPDRVAKLAEYFSADPDVTCVTCGAEYFGDKTGLFFPWALNRRLHLMEICALGLGQQGSTSAFRRSVFENFPPLGPESKAEDYALTFRAALLGTRLAIQDVLVRYRSHSGCLSNNTNTSTINSRKKKLSLSSMQQAEKDLLHYLKSNDRRPILALRTLRLHIHAYQRLADAAEAGRSTDHLSEMILSLLSTAKAYRLLHPLNWIKARKVAGQISIMKKSHLNS